MQIQNISGSDRKNLGKIRNFRAVTNIKKGFCATCGKKFTNLGKDLFIREHYVFGTKIEKSDTDSK